jgi:hypothetical protein
MLLFFAFKFNCLSACNCMNRVQAFQSLRRGSLSVSELSGVLGAFRDPSPLPREEFTLLISSVRSCVSQLDVAQCVSILKPVSELPRERMLPIAGDIFNDLMDRPLDAVSSTDAVRLISLCGKMHLYDSDLFNAKLFTLVDWSDFSSTRRVINACNQLKFVFANSDDLYTQICDLDLGIIAIPLLRYIARDVSSRPRELVAPKIVGKCIEAFSERVRVVRHDETLLKQRAVVSTDESLKFIIALAKISKYAGVEVRSLIGSKYLMDNLKFVLVKIVSYDLRNLSLDRLLRLFFSLGQLQLFDDFFVRRRLVPAISTTYKTMNQKSPQDIVLVATVISQLPFRVPLVDELVDILTKDAQGIPSDDEMYHTAQSLLQAIQTRP